MKYFTAPKWIVAPFIKVLLPSSVLGALICVYARFRFFAPIKPDEEAFIWYGSLIADGLVPYRDFFEPKPPVIFFANAIGLGLFGAKGPWFRLVPTAVAIFSLLFFYLALVKRRVIPWLAALLTAQGGFWLMGADFHDGSLNDTETYGLAFTLLGFSLASLSNSLKHEYGRIGLQVLGGVSLALAVLSKELFILSVIPAWLMAARRVDLGGWEWRNLLWSAVGGIGVGLLFVLYLGCHSALFRYFELAKFYKSFAVNYCMDVGRFPRLSGLALLKPSWKMLNEALYNFHQLAFVLALWAVGLPFLIFKRNVRLAVRLGEFVIPLIAVALGMLAISAGYCFWRHYFLMGMAGLLFLCLVGLEEISGFVSKRNWSVPLVAIAALTALFFWVAKETTRQVAAAPTTFASPTWDPIVIETIERHSKPGDYVLSTQELFLYVDLNRRAPLGTQMFLDEVLPYVTVGNPHLSMDALRVDLERHLPKVCFFGSWLRSRQQRFHQELFDPLLAKYHYVQVNDRLWYLPDGKD
jgi:hypothetical protein